MTDQMSPAISEALQTIAAQMPRHLALAKDMNSHHNALLPISRLPAEILGNIFHKIRGDHSHSRDDDLYFWTPDILSEPCSKWIAVSQVSRHWRNVAIADASLWTNPPLKNPNLTMMMLDRSRMATIPALTLQVEELDKCVVAALMPQIPRMSSLVMPFMAREMLTQVLASLPTTASQLRGLSINSLTKVTIRDKIFCQQSSLPIYDEALALPDNVLCYTPKLRRLHLSNITIKPDSPLLSNLTTLSMSGIPEKSKPTPHQFRLMLASAPYLKRLELNCVCPRLETMAPFLMEHLEYLRIDETIPRLISFFTNFSAAHYLKGLNINVNYAEGSASDLSLLFATLNRPYLYSIIGTGTDIRRLDIHKLDGTARIRALKLSESDRNLEPGKRNSAHDYSTSMCIHITSGIDLQIESEEFADLVMEMTVMMISDLFKNFTWTGLSELSLDLLDYAFPDPHVLASTFGTIPQLRIIATDADTAPWLIKALNHYSDAQFTPPGALSLPFAGVQHIDLSYTDLIQGDPNFEALRKYVQQRHEHGSPIISLKFAHCRLTEEVGVLLKKYVEHIIVRPAKSNHDHESVDSYSPYNHNWYI